MIDSHNVIASEITEKDCYNPTVIQSFLLLSRHLSDDAVPFDLNSLYKPDDLSLSLSKLTDRRRKYGGTKCKSYITTVLFPAWNSRDNLLDYCENIAKKDKKEQEKNINKINILNNNNKSSYIDPRIDPYEARNNGIQKENNSIQKVFDWIQNEREVESITRSGTFQSILEKCIDYEEDPRLRGLQDVWKDEYYDWKNEKH